MWSWTLGTGPSFEGLEWVQPIVDVSGRWFPWGGPAILAVVFWCFVILVSSACWNGSGLFLGRMRESRMDGVSIVGVVVGGGQWSWTEKGKGGERHCLGVVGFVSDETMR